MNKKIDNKVLDTIKQKTAKIKDKNKIYISVCGGTGCQAQGAEVLVGVFREEIRKQGLEKSVAIVTTGCHGFCEQGPIVVIHPEGIFYGRVKVKDVPEIVSETVVKNKVIKRLLYRDPKTREKIVREQDIPFYKKQKRVVFGMNGILDATSIEDYIYHGGYQALTKALRDFTPDGIIDEVKNSGLRGRGGAGFPTGKKWELCRNTTGDQKYIICNADEGDPGAFMDRSV